MSTFAVTVETLEIEPHPNADALELARIGGYRAVVAKGAFRSGELACYIPEQAILPDQLISQLGLEGRLAGSKKNRVKAVRLRGELSQGLVFVPDGWTQEDLAARTGEDLADELGITKWVPEIPTSFSGELEPCADLVPMFDVENIRRWPQLFEDGEPVVATEKLHGTCLVAGLVPRDGKLEMVVSSKGLSAKRLAIVETEENLYWQAVRAHHIEAALRVVAVRFGAERVFIYGEAYGAGVQDLTYGADARRGQIGYRAFDVWVETPTRRGFLTPRETETILDGTLLVVPTLYDGPYDYDHLSRLAEGDTQLGGGHIREGLVVRPQKPATSDITGGPQIAKFVSEAYLLRSGGTEYE